MEETIRSNFVAQLVQRDRQLVALPFWGIGGLGLLIGISFRQPLDIIATGIGFYVAFQVQKWGWEMQAKRLVIQTLDDIEAGVQADRAQAADA